MATSPTVRDETRRYFAAIRWGAGLFIIAQFLVTNFLLTIPDPGAAREASIVLGLLLGASGLTAGLASGIVVVQQKRLQSSAGEPFGTIFDLPWQSRVTRAVALQPIFNAVTLLLIGTALGYAASIDGLAAWRGIAVVLPTIVWAGGLTVYGTIVSQRLAFLRIREAVEAERAARELRAQAEMAALRAQINPHFLFNALNTVADLIDEAPERAERTVERLASIFRYTLARSPVEYAPLGDEVAFLRAYLDVERERFGDRLSVEWDVDAEAETLFVPTMLLQPLVENSLKHAVTPRREGGTVRIAARTSGGRLEVEVRDFGGPTPSLPLDAMLERGTGLSNVDERLRRAFGPESRIQLELPDGGGAAFRFSIPALRATDVGGVACAS